MSARIRSRILPSWKRYVDWVDTSLVWLSGFVAVVVVGIACLATAYIAYNAEKTRFLPDSVGALLPDPDNRMSLEDAVRQFDSDEAIQLNKGGALSFRTVWVRLNLGGQVVAGADRLSVESLRARNAQFWIIGADGQRIASDLAWRPTRSGIAVDLPDYLSDGWSLLGRVEPISINRIQVALRTESEISARDFGFERTGGLLIGALVMVSLFSFVVAIYSRDWTYFLYSVWLLTSLRIAGYNGNWDPHWLGIPLSGDSLQMFLRLSYIAHSLISLALFQALFKKELSSSRLNAPIRLLQLATLAMFVPALALAADQSIRLLWTLSSGTILVVVGVLVTLSFRAPSKALAWYFGSWAITLVGSVAQIAFSVGLTRTLPDIFTSQVTVVGAALMLGITLAQRMSAERQARIAAERSAVNALHRFRENYNAMPVGIFSMKHDGTITEHNPTFGDMFPAKRRSSSRVGTNWVDLMNSESLTTVRESTVNDQMMDTELAVESPNGARRWFHVRAVRKPSRFEGWIEDITSRKEAEGQLKFLVDHDSLTGLLNRRGFELRLLRAIVSAGDRPVHLAYVDLDRFKLVNDLFGHAAGDQILRQMATRMREVIHPPNVAARVGGDEFVVIIDGLSVEAARSLCESLRAQLSDRAYQYQDKAFSVTASIGLIRVLDDMRPADALTASDRACSEAKASGGGTVIAYDASSNELLEYLDEIKLVASMKERLPVESFFTQLQPIVSLRAPESSLSYEVLIRMKDSNGKTVPPSRFIPAAERNGLMTQIDRWVLRSTLEWLDSQPAHRDCVDFCTLNLSGASLNDERFLQDAIALIRAHAESSRKICFEITESVALYDLKTTRRFVDRVKSFGAMVALDDFGAGYTSFSYLKELPCDLVKIDGQFIRDMNLNSANFAIARAVVELAHELGMSCVAEWAENIDIVRSLIRLKVDYAQGYGLSRPLDRDQLLAVSNSVLLIQDQETASLVLGGTTASRGSARRITIPI